VLVPEEQTWIEEVLRGTNAVADRFISKLEAVHGDRVDWD
jgi:hypothetical protein